MASLDLKKELKHLYAPSTREVSVVNVPPMNFLMIDGKGNPNTSMQYQQAIEALYGLAYTVRFACKDAGDVFTVMPMEGLWCFEGDPIINFEMTEADKDRFIWTMMIVMPDSVTADIVESSREQLRKKKSPALLDDLRFEYYHEGDAAQIMHIGPYSEEGPNIRRIHEHIESSGWTLSGKHHEIYLSDPRRAAPDKMKTVVRQPFTR